jgi:hypothetical protein
MNHHLATLTNLNVTCRKNRNETKAILERTVVLDSHWSWLEHGGRDLNEFRKGMKGKKWDHTEYVG